MGAFIVKQPNGKYCRFSTVIDCPTHINMTEEDYIELYMQRAKEEAIDTFQLRIKPYEQIDECFCPSNMTKKEFAEVKKKMQDPNGKFEVL